MQNAKLILEGKEYELPVVVGTESEKAFDCQKLREQTGYITMDPGYGNTGACQSAITFIDGEAGILRYRGLARTRERSAPRGTTTSRGTRSCTRT